MRNLVGCSARGRWFGSRAVAGAGMGLAPAFPQLQTLLLRGSSQLVLTEETTASPQDAASVRPMTVVDAGHYIRMNRRTLNRISCRQAPE